MIAGALTMLAFNVVLFLATYNLNSRRAARVQALPNEISAPKAEVSILKIEKVVE